MDENSSNYRMSIVWKEREHSEVDNEVLGDREALDALRNCGLLKFYMLSYMKTQTQLLEMLVHYWDPDLEVFMIDQMQGNKGFL